MRSLIAALSLVPLAASSPLFSSVASHVAPLRSVTDNDIKDSYIVVFKDHVSDIDAIAHHDWIQDAHSSSQSVRDLSRKRSQTPMMEQVFNGLKHTYNIPGGMKGYSGHFDEDIIDQVLSHPDVAFVERDSEVHTMSDDGVQENNAPWGLARISHRSGLSFGNFNKYLYAEDGGEGVDVYIIDTGTFVDHVDFEGRAKWGKTIPIGDEDADGNGHGTHCSGTVAGKKYGVAKKANIIAVKVLRSNGSGTMSDVVKGVEYAVESHLKAVADAKKGKRKGFKGSSANMSLGGGKSPVLQKAVNAAVDAGIHFAVAAGNDNADSCSYSPADAENAVTVGASNLADERAYFSNYGPCNDIFAPGLNIQSTWIGSKKAINTISGTSMASPHVAGLLAYLLSLQPAKDSAYAIADISPKKLKKNLMSIATKGALSDVPSDTKNIMAWNGGGSSNYTEIVKGGAYDAMTSISIDIPDMAEIEEELEREYSHAKASIHRGSAIMSEKAVKGKDAIAVEAEKLGNEIESLIAEGLHELFENME